MTLQDNFNDHSKQYIFSNDELLSKERFKTFEKINLNKFDKKNNESLKNLSLSDLNSFNYYFQTSKEKPNVKVLSKNIYEINIVNGKCKNYNDDNIEIRNILQVFKLLYRVTLATLYSSIILILFLKQNPK